MLCFKSLKVASKLRCSTADIIKCRDNDKPIKDYFSDETTTMCAFKPGVETCFVSTIVDC